MMKTSIKLIDDDLVTPLCPHCEKPVDAIGARRIESTLGVRYLYFCRNCRRILGVSHRKGFWMG